MIPDDGKAEVEIRKDIRTRRKYWGWNRSMKDGIKLSLNQWEDRPGEMAVGENKVS